MGRWILRSTALLMVAVAAMVGYHAGAQDVPDQGQKNDLKVGQVMRVGTKVITAEDLISRVWDFERVIPQDERVLANSLTYLRDTALLDLEAERMGIKVTDAELESVTQQQLDAIKQKVKDSSRGMLPYDRWLEQQGMTKEQFEKYVRDRAYVILMKRFLVTHFEATNDSIVCSHILVQKLERAKDLHGRLKAGEAAGKNLQNLFEDLAVQHSEDPTAGVTRGRLPQIYELDGTLEKSVAEACFKLKDGEYSEPVQSSYGWHIVLRLQTVKRETKPFAEMRKELFDSPDVNETRFNRWVRWVFNKQGYSVERRLPGFDVKANTQARIRPPAPVNKENE